MRNIYVFFWVSLAVKILVFAALNFFIWDINSYDKKQVLLYGIAALLFTVISFLKFRGAGFFGKYFKLLEYEFTFIFISALALKDFGFGVIAAFTIIEWQLYLKEFCIIKPGKKFDGDTKE